MFTKAKTLIATMALCLLTMAGAAEAGRGGSSSRIRNAVATGSVDAIIAEIERTEKLICGSCVEVVSDLLEHDRYELREVAAWWFAKRPALAEAQKLASFEELAGSDSVRVRNAADFLGTLRRPDAIAALSTAVVRTDISVEARVHLVKALGTIGHAAANPALRSAMNDSDGEVRAEAVSAWLAIRGQTSAAPVVALVSDAAANVRAKAAGVVGNLREASARVALEGLVVSDPDPVVRRNAAWALGRIGDRASRSALELASSDSSSLVRLTASAAISSLR